MLRRLLIDSLYSWRKHMGPNKRHPLEVVRHAAALELSRRSRGTRRGAMQALAMAMGLGRFY